MNKMLSVLGLALAKEIGKEEFICRGLLRLTIIEIAEQAEELLDPGKIQAYIDNMKFEDWESLFRDDKFTRRLKNMGVLHTDKIIQNMQKTLVQTQSLIVLSVR